MAFAARTPFLAFLFAAAVHLSAGTEGTISDELVFTSDFANNRGLKGWTDVHQNTPPNMEGYQVVAGDEVYVKTPPVLFGISHRLGREIVIDSTIVDVMLTATLRKPETDGGHQIGIALSSRDSTAQDAGGPFWKGRDSGFMANGYHHGIQKANFICWQVEGARTRLHPSREPFNLLTGTGEWVTWRLVYKHKEKELWFFRDASEQSPFMIQRNVDLTGVGLSSVWISAWGTEFKEVTVRKIIGRRP